MSNKDVSGSTALYLAARGGHHECLELLIKAGGDVNTAKKDGETALIAAAK